MRLLNRNTGLTARDLRKYKREISLTKLPAFMQKFSSDTGDRLYWTDCYMNALNMGMYLHGKGHSVYYKEAMVRKEGLLLSHAWLEVDGIDYDITGNGRVGWGSDFFVPSMISTNQPLKNSVNGEPLYMVRVLVDRLASRMMQALENNTDFQLPVFAQSTADGIASLEDYLVPDFDSIFGDMFQGVPYSHALHIPGRRAMPEWLQYAMPAPCNDNETLDQEVAA